MCMIDGGEGGSKVATTDYRKAIKDHTCCECHRVISKGERYYYISILADSWGHYKTCEHCQQGPCSWLMVNCRGYICDYALEDLKEHFEEEASSYPAGDKFAMGRMLVAAKKKWSLGDGLMPLPSEPLSVARMVE